MAKTKVELQNYQGESLSPITIASNVLYEDGRNAQEVFEEYSNETFTPTIENSSSMFKVGQGDSVDYSGNIVNGAYESMVLKGKSMVNCIQEPSSQDVVLPYEFEEGRYVTINDTKESGALGVELKGQTLVNLISINRVSITSGASHEYPYNIVPTIGKKYLIKVKIKSVGESTNSLPVKIQPFNSGTAAGYFNITSNDYFVGNEITKIITCIDGDNIKNGKFTIWCRDLSSGTFECDIVMLEYQEGMENWDIPYFEGMTSCKMPTLHTVGSLFDAQKIIPNNAFTYSHSTNIGRFEFTNRVDVVANTNIQLPAGTYDISFLVRGACDNGRVAITFAKDGQVWHNCSRVEINYGEIGSTTFKEVKSQRTFDAPVTVTIVGHAWSGGATGSGWCEFKDIRFTPVGKTSILSLPEDLELRAIGDVKDTLDLTTGEVVQNIYEFTLDGSQNIDNDGDLLYYYLPFGVHNNKSISDKLPSITVGQIIDGLVGIAPQHRGNSSRVYIKVNGITTKEEMKNFFLNNPTTIQCILATPTIKTVDLNVVDQNGNVIPTLKSWNTTTHIYSEIPENSLHPILSHSNPSYPVILKPSTKYSIVANSYSNDHTNSAINFNLGGATASTTVGNRVTTITTPSTLSNELLTMSGRGNKLNNVMVIEGDVAGDEPYFEGICDCKTPILSNVGKNILNPLINFPLTIVKGGGMEKNDGNLIAVVPVKPNTTYIMSSSRSANKGRIIAKMSNRILKKEELAGSTFSQSSVYNFLRDNYANGRTFEKQIVTNTEILFTTLEDCYYLYVNIDGASNMETNESVEISWIQIEEASSKSEYLLHKSNTTTFDQKDGKTIVLRSLPDGTCDTLNVETGEYVQRIGEVVLNGSESWVADNVNLDTRKNFSAYTTIVDKKDGGQSSYGVVDNATLNDKLCQGAYDYLTGSRGDNEGSSGMIQKRFLASISKSKLPTQSLAGFKTYLQSNPITVQYELATPIVSTIDVQGFPYAYTSGHVQISSGHNAQSLTPKVEYSVATNRNGQIRSNQKMVERHQKQLDQLQAIILANMVNTQYQQTLTTLNYDLLKKEVGE